MSELFYGKKIVFFLWAQENNDFITIAKLFPVLFMYFFHSHLFSDARRITYIQRACIQQTTQFSTTNTKK